MFLDSLEAGVKGLYTADYTRGTNTTMPCRDPIETADLQFPQSQGS